jgi:hypothetical protein
MTLFQTVFVRYFGTCSSGVFDSQHAPAELHSITALDYAWPRIHSIRNQLAGPISAQASWMPNTQLPALDFTSIHRSTSRSILIGLFATSRGVSGLGYLGGQSHCESGEAAKPEEEMCEERVRAAPCDDAYTLGKSRVQARRVVSACRQCFLKGCTLFLFLTGVAASRSFSVSSHSTSRRSPSF